MSRARLHAQHSVTISKGRFEAFSDGVFAIAITLLVLEFHAPELKDPSNATLLQALLSLWPQYAVYTASFATIGIMWFNHYALFHNVARVSYGALIANLALLLFVCFLPFPTLILGRYGLVPAAVMYYALTLLVISLCFNVLYYVAKRQSDDPGSIVGFIATRNAWNTVGLVAYALAAWLAYVNPIAGIALIVAMAVYYMLPSSVRSSLGPPAAPE